MYLVLSIAGLFLILQNVNCQIKDAALQDTVLKLHNGYRRLQMASDMKKLVWDPNLASEAAAWTKNCIYEFRYGSYGENMYYFESRLPDNVLVERAVDAWYSERYSWRMSGDCAEACSYTQLVWAKTQRVGCAIQKCTELTMPEEFIPAAWFIYCLYDPKGNTFGDLPYSRGGACEKCEAKEVCSDKLCADKYAPTTPQPVKTTLPPTLPPSRQISRGSQSSNTEMTQLELQHRTALEKQQALLEETLKKQRALEEQLRTQQKLIEQTLMVGKSQTTAKPIVKWNKGLPADRRSELDQGSTNTRNGMLSSSMLGTRSGPTDDKTEFGRRQVQMSSVSDRDSRRKPVTDVQEASFFSFHRPRNQFSSVRLWQPTTTRAPLFVLNPQPQMSSLQKTVTSMRPLKPNKNRVSFTIGSGNTLKFNYKPNSALVTKSQRESALPNQNKLDLSASDNFRFGGARSFERQLASTGNLRSKERQHSSLSIYKAHSSSQISTSDQKQTASSGGQSLGRGQYEVNSLQSQTTKQNSVSDTTLKRQAPLTSDRQSQKRQSPDFRSRTVFTSRTKAPSTTTPSYLPASPTLPPTKIPPDCVDKDVYCPYWKVYCDNNSYVFENCRRTCRSCYVPPPPIIPQPLPGLRFRVEQRKH